VILETTRFNCSLICGDFEPYGNLKNFPLRRASWHGLLIFIKQLEIVAEYYSAIPANSSIQSCLGARRELGWNGLLDWMARNDTRMFLQNVLITTSTIQQSFHKSRQRSSVCTKSYVQFKLKMSNLEKPFFVGQHGKSIQRRRLDFLTWSTIK